MNREKLMAHVEEVEGRKYEMYMLDNVPHIGIGHNIVCLTASMTFDRKCLSI